MPYREQLQAQPYCFILVFAEIRAPQKATNISCREIDKSSGPPNRMHTFSAEMQDCSIHTES